MKQQNLLTILRDEYSKARSAWDRAVWADAFDMVAQSEFNELNLSDYQEILLNGARSWHEYSWGGCGLVYDMEIARHYCTASELQRTKEGLRRPNKYEDWLDVQARALNQACQRIGQIIYKDYIANK